MAANGPRRESVELGFLKGVYEYYLPGAAPDIPILPFTDPLRAFANMAAFLSRMSQSRGGPPVRAQILEHMPTPWQNGQAAFILYDAQVGGKVLRGYSLVATMRPSQGMWMYYYSTVSAPPEVFKAEFATLLEIWRSWSLGQRLLSMRIQDAARSMRQAGEILVSASRIPGQGMERAARGWDLYIWGIVPRSQY